MKKNKYFKKLFLVYLIIAIIYTCVIAGVSIYNNNLNFRIELDNKNRLFLEQSRRQVDTRLMVALKYIEGQKTSKEFKKYINSQKHDYYNVLKIYEELSGNQTAFSELGYEIGVLKQQDDLVICSGSTRTIEDYFKDYGFSDENKKEFKTLFDEDTGVNSYIVINSRKNNSNQADIEEQYTTFVKKERIELNKYIFVLITFRDISILPQLNQDNVTLIFAKENDIVKIAKNSLFSELNYKELSGAVKKYIDDSFEYQTENDNKYMVYSVESVVLQGLRYIYVTSSNKLLSTFGKLLSDNMIIYLVLLLSGVALLFVSAKKTYTPIKKIVNIFMGYDSYSEERDEMVFIEKTALNLRNSNESLHQIINDNQLSLKTKFLRDLLFGLISNEEIKENLSKYKINYLNKVPTAVVLKYTNNKNLYEVFSRESIVSIKSQIFNTICEKVKRSVPCEIFELNQKNYVIIAEKKDIELLKKILKNVLLNIMANFDLSLVAAIGESVHSIYQIQDSLDICLKLLEYQMITDRHLLITADDLKNLNTQTYYYTLDSERNLINYTIRAKKEDAIRILNNILEENLIKRKLSEEALNLFIFAITGTINRILHKLNFSENKMFRQENIPYLEFKMCEDTEKLNNKIVEIFNHIIKNIDNENEQKDNKFAEEMISYVHDHYADSNLSLTDMGEYFGLSTGYISKVFKSHVGENFKDYLSIHRIKMAKKIMNNEQLTIKELAARVGFNHSNNFIRTFKLYECISPGKYLKNCK